MEITITEDMVIDWIKKYYKTVDNDKGRIHFDKIIEASKDKRISVDNVLNPLVILDTDCISTHENLSSELKVISVDGKIVLPFTFYASLSFNIN